MEELQLKAKKAKHKIQMKLAEAEAKTLSESEPLPVTPSGTPTEYMVSTTTKKRLTQALFVDESSSKQTQEEPKLEYQSPLSVHSIPVQSAMKEKKETSCSNDGDSLVHVMKRQNEITELLLNQQVLSQLP